MRISCVIEMSRRVWRGRSSVGATSIPATNSTSGLLQSAATVALPRYPAEPVTAMRAGKSANGDLIREIEPDLAESGHYERHSDLVRPRFERAARSGDNNYLVHGQAECVGFINLMETGELAFEIESRRLQRQLCIVNRQREQLPRVARTE